MSKISLTQRTRRGLVHDGVMLGYAVEQIAEYCGVSASTVRRDLRSMPSTAAALRSPNRWQYGPDAHRWTP